MTRIHILLRTMCGCAGDPNSSSKTRRSAHVALMLALICVGGTTLTVACNESTAPDRTASGIHALADLPTVTVTDCGPGYYGTYPNCVLYNYDPHEYEQDPCYLDYYAYDCPGYVDTSTDGGGYYYDWHPGDPGVPCETGNPLLDAPGSDAGFAQLWKDSDPDNPTFGDRHERAGWIVRKADGSYYVFEWPNVGTVCGMDVTGLPEPPEGLSAVVGYVHTHPYIPGDYVAVCANDNHTVTGFVQYAGGPSNADRNTSVALGQQVPWSGKPGPLPGVILDKSGTRTFVGTSTDKDVNYSRCGF